MIASIVTTQIPTYRFDNIIKGDTYDGNSFELLDYDTNEPINLTDVTEIKAQFRLSPSDNVALTFSISGGQIVITDPILCKFDILEQLSIDIPAGEYRTDFEFTYSTGVKKTYMKAIWVIEQDYTHD